MTFVVRFVIGTAVLVVASCASDEGYRPPRMAEDCSRGLALEIYETADTVEGFAWNRFGDQGCTPCAELIVSGYRFFEARLSERFWKPGLIVLEPKPGLYRYERVRRTEVDAETCERFDQVIAELRHLVPSHIAHFAGLSRDTVSRGSYNKEAVSALFDEYAEKFCVRAVLIAEVAADYEVSEELKSLGNFPSNGRDGLYSLRATYVRNKASGELLARGVDRYAYLNPGYWGPGSGNSASCWSARTVPIMDVLEPVDSGVSTRLQSTLSDVRN